jgi:hypothetical protein
MLGVAAIVLAEQVALIRHEVGVAVPITGR